MERNRVFSATMILVIFGLLAIGSARATDSTVTQLTNDGTNAQTCNSNLIWQSYDGSSWKVLRYDGTSTTQVYDCSRNNLLSRAWKSNVVRESICNEFFLYHGNNIVQLADDLRDNWSPEPWGSSVDWRGYGLEIFLAAPERPATLGLLKLDGLVMLGHKRAI